MKHSTAFGMSSRKSRFAVTKEVLGASEGRTTAFGQAPICCASMLRLNEMRGSIISALPQGARAPTASLLSLAGKNTSMLPAKCTREGAPHSARPLL